MRILITDDDPVCSVTLAAILKPYGECETARDGGSAIRTFTQALVEGQPFGLVCLDIEMPDLDGQATLRCLRSVEEGFGRIGSQAAKMLMVSSLHDGKSVTGAFRGQCDGYLVKPIQGAQILAQVAELGIAAAAAR